MYIEKSFVTCISNIGYKGGGGTAESEKWTSGLTPFWDTLSYLLMYRCV